MSGSSRNRLAFAASLAGGLLVALAVGAYAGGIGVPGSGSAPVDDGIAPLEAMRVFDRPPTAAERVTAEGRASLEELSRDEPGVAESLLPGDADPLAARTLISDAGTSNWSIVAAPTAKGRVCAVLLDARSKGDSGGCVERFTDALPALPAVSFDASGAVVSGLASDAVTAVSVVLRSEERRALLKNNAFLYELPGIDDLVAVRVTLHDGSQVAIPLGP